MAAPAPESVTRDDYEMSKRRVEREVTLHEKMLISGVDFAA